MLAKIFRLRSLTALEIVQYPHPTLRYKSKPITRVDRELRDIVKSMFALMYEAKGIGLAANQVDLPLQLFIVNTKEMRSAKLSTAYSPKRSNTKQITLKACCSLIASVNFRRSKSIMSSRISKLISRVAVRLARSPMTRQS